MRIENIVFVEMCLLKSGFCKMFIFFQYDLINILAINKVMANKNGNGMQDLTIFVIFIF